MRIDVDAICRNMLAQEPTEADLDAKVERVCRNLYGDRYRAAARAVLDAVRRHAERQNVSRVEALAELGGKEAEARVEKRIYTSPDEMPPDIREKFERAMRDGGAGIDRHVRVLEWDAADGPPSEEVARAARQALGPDRAKPGEPIIRRRGTRWRYALLLTLVVLVLAGLELLSGLRRVRRSFRSLALQIEQLEEQLEDAPGDVATSLALGAAYAQKLIVVRSVTGRTQAGSPALGSEAADRLRERAKNLEETAGISATDEEARATAARGEQLARAVLARAGLTPIHEARAQVLLGHFLLGQGRAEEARKAARRAEELDPKDIGPHLLNAVIAEVAGEHEAAVRENRKAADKLSAWARRDPAQRQYVAWGMGTRAITDETPWWGEAEQTAQRVREALELHTTLLRMLAGAQKTQDALGPRY